MATSSTQVLRDVNGRVLRSGVRVRFLHASAGLLRGLAASDKRAIRAAVGGIYRVRGRSAYGDLELQFRDAAGTIHFIWVEPGNLRLVRSSTTSADRHLTSRSTRRASRAGERRR
jgi:hypothetical protein